MNRPGRRCPRVAALLVLGAASVACDPAMLPTGPVVDPGRPRAPAEAPRARSDAAGRVRVAYPGGDCPTRRIEVQVHRDGAWRPHPEHPVVGAGSVRWERSEDLLALRVRCIDPRDRSRTSAWVTGVRVEGGPPPAAAERR